MNPATGDDGPGPGVRAWTRILGSRLLPNRTITGGSAMFSLAQATASPCAPHGAGTPIHSPRALTSQAVAGRADRSPRIGPIAQQGSPARTADAGDVENAIP